MSSIQQYWAEPLVAQQEFVGLYVNGAYTCLGTLCYAGSCRMIDEFGDSGARTFLGWTLFGDPSVRVVGSYESCPADLNHDGLRNFEDFAIFSGHYGGVAGEPTYDAAADFNDDGRVDFADFAAFSGYYGVPCP
jgi:hypothetical protein